ncbi:hypothetical protein GPALN_002227 [Globodera pallida]|nr:hypothetical protein GPALN_002227 [Globodera pallida]
MNAQLRLATLLPTVRMARTSQQSANQTPTSHTPGSLGLVGHGLRLESQSLKSAYLRFFNALAFRRFRRKRGCSALGQRSRIERTNTLFGAETLSTLQGKKRRRRTSSFSSSSSSSSSEPRRKKHSHRKKKGNH